MFRPIRSLTALLLATGLGLAGCAAPEPAALASADAASDAVIATPAPVAVPPSAPVTPPRRAPPMSDPLPPQQVPEAEADNRSASTDPVAALDRSCRTSADCAVKNVGSCCGYMPACVNTNAQPDPDAVQAQCAKQGMASVCGFQEIRSCQCVQGKCEADAAGGVIR